jgi:subtilisin family serine protease
VLFAFAAGPALARPADQPALDRVSSHLRAAHGLAAERVALERLATADPLLRVRAGELEIEIRFAALSAEAVEAMRALGVRIEHVSYRYGRVLAHADPTLLPALAALPGVTSIHPNYGAQRNAGAVPGQGDMAVHADAARARFGVDGTGVRIGILSDSFSQRIDGELHGSGCARQLSASNPQISGDLPAAIVVLDDGPAGSSDEGAAMAEIVHDLAPGAALLFASAFPDEATFAEGIDALVACGADVLVDDVLFYAEPMFQDGIIAQAAQAAVDGGAAFFSAVGNQGVAGVDQVYRDAVPELDDEAEIPTGNDFHDFGGGTRFASIGVPPGCTLRLALQWDEPFSGTLGPGASTDLDLYVFSGASPGAPLLAAGTDSQGCSASSGGPSGDPLEMAAFTNASSAMRTVYLAVDHFCGRPDVRFRIVTLPADCTNAESYVFAPAVFSAEQIYGHAAAAGVAAVAAVFYGEIDSGGAVRAPSGVINVEPFSARGGALQFPFDAQGRRLPDSPRLRFKPDLAAPDGVNTSFFGRDSLYDDDLLPNFFGTSAAAPHAAAVAALLRQANPALPPAALLDTLRRTAADIEGPGRDPLAGYGLVDAYAALAALAMAPTPTATPLPSPTPTAGLSLPCDCGGDGRVTVDELIRGVRIALGQAALSTCVAADSSGDGRVEVGELVQGVAAVLGGQESRRGEQERMSRLQTRYRMRQ